MQAIILAALTTIPLGQNTPQDSATGSPTTRPRPSQTTVELRGIPFLERLAPYVGFRTRGRIELPYVHDTKQFVVEMTDLLPLPGGSKLALSRTDIHVRDE